MLITFILPAVKSAGALPENPASTAALNAKIAAVEKPAPQPIPPLPKIAQTISGKKYLLDDGEAFTLTFTGDQATLDWSYKDQAIQFPVGMDNYFRTTPFDQTEMTNLFGGTERQLGPVIFALRGSWIRDVSFGLTIQVLDSVRLHTVIFIFAEDKVRYTLNKTSIGDSVSFQGTVQAQ